MKTSMISLLHQTSQNFQRHKAQWMAAAIAYFITFAIAPSIIGIVEIVGLIVGQHRPVLDEIYGYIGSTAGTGAANAVQAIVHATFDQERSGAVAKSIGWLIFLFATIGLYGALKDALNTVWDVSPSKQTIAQLIRSRAVALLVIIAIALLLMAALAVNGALTVAGSAVAHSVPAFPIFVRAFDIVLSYLVVVGLFGFMFRFLPDCHVEWRDVWVGSAATALLYVVGQSVLGWYLGRIAIGSAFGTYASLIAFLLWTNYSAQIMLFGAEFTHVYAYVRGSHHRIEPSPER